MLTDESALALSPSSSSAFLASLQSTVSHCAAAGKTALWLHLLGPSSAPLLPLAFAAGFTFHHADGHNASLALWLPSLPAHPAHGLASKIPDYATHQVGVGALVYHAPTASVLCVREVGRNYSKWKLPGGLLDARESLDAAACREVGEETGVKADYGGLLGFRHSVGGGQFGRSDLYYVCWMTPSEVCEKRDEKGRPMPSAQEGEITDTEWVPFKELYDMYGENGGSPHPMLRKVLDIAKDVLPGNNTIGVELEGDGGKGRDIQRTLLKSVVPGRKPMPFYHVEQTKKA
jgi:8-oxo-dGTP pyrophosphatase MutT (NUDIX family)